MPKEREKGKDTNKTRKRRAVGQHSRQTQFLVKHSREMNAGIGTLRGRSPLILVVLKTKLCKIWKLHPSFSRSAVSIFTRPFRRSAAATNALTDASACGAGGDGELAFVTCERTRCQGDRLARRDYRRPSEEAGLQYERPMRGTAS